MKNVFLLLWCLLLHGRRVRMTTQRHESLQQGLFLALAPGPSDWSASVYGVPPVSTEEWEEKKALFDEKTANMSWISKFCGAISFFSSAQVTSLAVMTGSISPSQETSCTSPPCAGSTSCATFADSRSLDRLLLTSQRPSHHRP